ncbi:E3 SUMO-protein ligase ZBED1 [Frankliniella fusca]|uniref:E3 SUMO-protein ligase ZBED1 n=1 Tax=Frankliniella fusca TaxID=407009 RepID=A0AAE1HSL7_9NEOP|nr:E3 SUMO-protein ligase ZBED1 [Frankliniella fusca]
MLLSLRHSCDEISEKEEQQRNAKRRRTAPTRLNATKNSERCLPNLKPAEWDCIEAYCTSLEPAKIATMLFQREQLTVGDCYAAWLRCEEATKKLPSTLARNLVISMVSRRRESLKTEAFAPGIFMDPRYKGLLDPHDKATAMVFLEALWMRLNHHHQHQAGQVEDAALLDDPGVMDVEEDGEDALERLLRESDTPAAALEQAKNISALLQDYWKWKRLDKDASVLEFWETKKSAHPELYALATVALSVPMTQVSVERTFSHLRQILSILRYNLSPSVINDIILVKCNAAFDAHNSE